MLPCADSAPIGIHPKPAQDLATEGGPLQVRVHEQAHHRCIPTGGQRRGAAATISSAETPPGTRFDRGTTS